MNKKKIILLHVFTWLFAAFLNLKDFSLLANPEQLSMYLVSTAFLAVPFYLFYFFVVPRFLEKKRYYLFFIVSLAILVVLTFIGYSALFLVKSVFSHDFHNFYGVYSLKMHFSGMSVISIAATFGSFFKVILNWLNTMNQKEILEKEKAVSELALLKSKVNPHFLFNTLNNIDVLIYDNPDKASQSLLKLSEILRYMTYETVSEFVSLSKEINYISGIVSLYALRVSDPGLIRLTVPEQHSCLNIAPMLFVPFIENAFKYATFKGENAGVEINFWVEEKKVHFTAANHYDTTGKSLVPEYGGTGIANVRRRLEHIYGGRYRLDILDKDGFFSVELTIDTHGD
jgi:two-component system, LytTR family, sensor kinase